MGQILILKIISSHKSSKVRTLHYPLPHAYRCPLPVPSLVVSQASPAVCCRISPGTHQAGYGRFKPNNRDHHSGRGYYRGGWHPSSPPLPRPPVFRGQQPQQSWGTPGPLVGRKPIAKVARG